MFETGFELGQAGVVCGQGVALDHKIGGDLGGLLQLLLQPKYLGAQDFEIFRQGVSGELYYCLL